MKYIRILLTSLALAGATTAGAASHGDGKIEVRDPWSRELPPVSANGAVYVVIMNPTDEPDRLMGAYTPASAYAEVHTHKVSDGMMRMMKVEGGLEVPAKGQAVLAPGGNHLMLMKLTEPLPAGRRFPLTLQFQRAGTVEVEVEVLSMEAAAAKKTAAAHGHESMQQAPKGHKGMKHGAGSN